MPEFLQKTDAKEVFHHFAGECFLNGKNVSVCRDEADTYRVLCAETTGNKKLSKTLRISKDDYKKLREIWTDGCSDESDVRITQRALDFCLENGSYQS